MTSAPSTLAETRAVCIDQCGSRCCRTPSMRLHGTTRFMRRMKQLAAGLGVEARFLNRGRDQWELRFADHGGSCPFLHLVTGECRIYDDRPDACRRFPHRPFTGCRLWPGQPGVDPPVGPREAA